MTEGRKEKMKAAAKSLLKDIGRAALCYLLFVSISFILNMLFVNGGLALMRQIQGPSMPVYILASALLPFSYYSITRAFELYDKEAQAAYPFENGIYYKTVEGARLIFTNPTLRRKLLVHMGVALAFILIMPYQFGYTFVVRSFYPEVTPPAYAKWQAAAIVAPVICILTLLSKTSAQKWWCIAREAERRKILEGIHPNISLLFQMIKITVVYCISFSVLPTVIFMIISLALTVGIFTLWIWIAIFSAIFLLVFIRLFTAYRRRKKFLRALRRSAKENGIEIGHIKRPVLSLFFPHRGADFTFTQDGATYTCKLIGTTKRSRPMYISPEGFVTEKKTVSILRMTLFHIMTDTDYAMEGENKTVILTPLPKRVFINYGRTDTALDDGDGGTLPAAVTIANIARHGSANTPSRGRSLHGPGYVSDLDKGIIKPFETGERVGDYKFFTPEGFLSAMDNHCLDR